MAPLRNQTFFSLGELRDAIGPLLAALNERPFKKTDGSRRSWFEDLDRPALKRLPAQRYEYAEWRKARVNIDYHIQVEHALYSVPHPLAHPEQGYRSCLGLKALLRAYGAERLEAACRRALDIGTLSYKSVKSILSTGLDQAGDDQQYTLSLPGHHTNIRGPGYYTTSQNGKES